jgi:hypothetical protein
MPAPAEVFRVFAIKYAHHDRLSSANFIGGDSHDARPAHLAAREGRAG